MIDGITILDTTNTWVCDSVLFDIFFIMVFILSAMLLMSLVCGDDGFTVVLLLSAVIIFSFLTFAVYKTNGKKVPEYKVTISDTVSFKDVYEKYNILKQEGEIYTIIEKTAEDS